MAESWAARLASEDVPATMLELLTNDARGTLRRNGRTAFPPNVEDLLAEWDKYAVNDYRETTGRHWSEHDADVKARHYSDRPPLISTLHRQREAPVVCHCKYSDGYDRAAKVSPDGSRWLCAHHGKPSDCGFVCLAEDTLKAPLPSKSYYGRTLAETRPVEVAMSVIEEPSMSVELTDEEILQTLCERCEVKIPQGKETYFTAFARWLANEIPADVWTLKIGRAMYPKWQQEQAQQAQQSSAA